MALAAGSFTHMPVLPTQNYVSKKSMAITIKCANNNKNKTKVVGKKPTGRKGRRGLGTGPKTENAQGITIPPKTSDDDQHDKNINKTKTKVGRRKPPGSTGGGGLGTGPHTNITKLPKNPPKDSDDDEDQLDNTFAFNLTGNEWVVIYLFSILFVGSTLFNAH
ncbi:hypothetical protein MtrunA17_Chr2g0315331 [Medicago truncatula]|uniref:Transmembrane protein, putative n=1 Tax=Medicago truncatula TaxID=3880 RepID=G7IR22_MEDTR|nr:uncharacterized protein LOC11408395 [Medicago truncatula]AES66543.1 transmembrane protein, putative [Medicago truncatula]RHN74899.1 hypothetical protein MtrunA17_Chr2g0315331 [Medicago truncatula]